MRMVFWLIPGKLGGSPIPSPHDLRLWKEMGIKAVVSLVEDYEFLEGADVEAMRRMGFEVLWIPTPDMTAPSVDDLIRMARWIDTKLREGKPVVVHCYGGYGRTGTALAAYLIFKGREPDEAISEVRRVRPGAIMVLSQEAVLYALHDALRELGSGGA